VGITEQKSAQRHFMSKCTRKHDVIIAKKSKTVKYLYC